MSFCSPKMLVPAYVAGALFTQAWVWQAPGWDNWSNNKSDRIFGSLFSGVFFPIYWSGKGIHQAAYELRNGSLPKLIWEPTPKISDKMSADPLSSSLTTCITSSTSSNNWVMCK